eukprot:56636-Eustigmatos_ZCMA.PRE.1
MAMLTNQYLGAPHSTEAPTDPDTALTGAVDLNSVVSVDNGVPAEMEEGQQQPDRKNCFRLDLNGKALVLK